MKKMIKTGTVALAILAFAACSGKKSTGGDTTATSSTTVKVDSTVKTTVDSGKMDTAKLDTVKPK